MEVVYRKLKPDETGIYRQIRLECLRQFPDWFGSTYEESIKLEKLHGEKIIEQAKPEKFILGAFSGDALIGICACSRELRRKTGHRAEITQVYIKPEFQGKKIGEGMIRAMIKEAFLDEEVEQLELGVETTNASAIGLYEKVGFEHCGHIKHYFKDRGRYFDEYLMILYRNPIP